MSRALMPLVALLALTASAGAQTATPPSDPPAPAESTAAPAPGQPQPPGGDFANDQTYRMKDGGMYQPPAERPASPAQDIGSGRT